MLKDVTIGNKVIGPDQPAFIIAEASANHCGSLEKAKEMIEVSKECGADCIKFQTYFTEDFCGDKKQLFSYKSQGKIVTEPQFEMFKRYEFSRDQWIEIIDYCNQTGMLFMTTIQGIPELSLMLDLGLQAIKVGSDDFDHVDNIERYMETGLPVILSKGMADLGEVDRVINRLQTKTEQLMILQCVSLYPTDPGFLNINQIKTLQNIYKNVIWGFSDHSLGTLASVLAVTLGAKIIEKHFTLDKNLPGPDHWFSISPDELKKLVEDIRFAEKALGTERIIVNKHEKKSKEHMRRRVVAKEKLKPGDVISKDKVDFLRSSQGLYIEDFDIIDGQTIKVTKEQKDTINLADISFR